MSGSVLSVCTAEIITTFEFNLLKIRLMSIENYINCVKYKIVLIF